ncbi:hypothetical protein [Bacillus sp. AK128]
MKNKSIPFIVLAIIHAVLLIICFRRKGPTKTIGVLYISIGIAYVFEYFVLNIFKMYVYCPKIFKNKWFDAVFGALLSQSLFIPIKSTLITLFNIGWKGRITVALIYGIIERIFIRWGIFENKSWKTFLTITTMPVYFYIVKIWWEKIQKGNKKIIAISIFFFYWVNYANVLYFALVFFKQYRFRIGVLRDKYWEHFIIVPIYALITGIIGTISTLFFRKEHKWISIFIVHVLDQILYKYRIIKPSTPHSKYALILIHLGLLRFGEYFKNLINRVQFTNEKASLG